MRRVFDRLKFHISWNSICHTHSPKVKSMSKLTRDNKPKRNSAAKRRKDFSPSTREHIAKAAGYLCSIRGCLRPSTCIKTKPNGDVGSANLGRASHIYAAAENGPRPAPIGMALELISHHSNGIWTCNDCGIKVDVLESEFTPDDLKQMKRVREKAAHMAVTDPEVSACAAYIAAIQFDEVFWNHLPDLDSVSIRDALLVLKASAILLNRPGSVPQTPKEFALSTLANAIKALTESAMDEPAFTMSRPTTLDRPNSLRLPDSAKVRRRAAQIVDAWAECIPSDHPFHKAPGEMHRGEVNVQITARHPSTKVEHESSIWVVATGHGRHSHSTKEGEMLRLYLHWTTNAVNNLEWELEVVAEDGRTRVTSDLRVLNPTSIPNFYTRDWDEELSAYEHVLRALADDWEPIGYVDMNRGTPRIDAQMHPEPFEIELKMSKSKIEECLYRCGKIRLGLELQAQWGDWEFKATPEYFEHLLDHALIQEASDELRHRLGPPPYYWKGESAPLLSNDKWDIRLVARHGSVAFKTVERRKSPAR
ncbi:hypothetical protein AXYL_06793 (plasmid) [Achromobacter xylosoxidans A8]|uniref:Uncharacterized protein n=2 Tax=Alcaligenes xylosoxydans xylosoxydans TaxID=85698 RepID=E3HYC1_ACHXA|nr:hypothetical protein AXYL_06793 [Achromobacter xylosoxidans A8]